MLERILPMLCCPETGSALKIEGDSLTNNRGMRYPVTDGIPRLLTPTKSAEEERVRAMMQKFYEQFTFPGYDGIDSPAVLMDKAGKSGFGAWVDAAISPFATVVEIGCGTGQMSNYLGIVSTRTVIGVDQSVASLRLAQGFRDGFDMHNVDFLQGNIFALPLAEDIADVVICSGVLHHTPDPEGGFREILKRVKPGGHVIIGLYNAYARIPLGIRKAIFSTTGNAFRWLDSHMRRRDVDASKKEIWFADQYKNPHESWHSVDEVLGWFDKNHVEYLSGVPDIAGKLPGEEAGMRLFEPHPRGNPMTHVIKQLGWMFTIGREGGLFVLIGRRSLHTS